LLNTLKEKLCIGDHREERHNFCEFCKGCARRALSKCTGCIEKNSILSSVEKKESPRTLENSAKLGIEQVHRVHRRTLFEFCWEEKCQGETLTELLNTLLSSTRRLENKVVRRTPDFPSRTQKGESPRD
jgi:hypothetical protein